jgi:hypothetical protein
MKKRRIQDAALDRPLQLNEGQLKCTRRLADFRNCGLTLRRQTLMQAEK